jgi:putative endonuclease
MVRKFHPVKKPVTSIETPLGVVTKKPQDGGKWIIHFVYIVECKDGTFYTGYTTDPERRTRRHNSGDGAKYTRSRLPVRLIWFRRCETKSLALKMEARVKKLSRGDKKSLIYGVKTI